SVKRNGKHDVDFRACSLDVGNNARGRKRNTTLGNGHAVASRRDQQRLLDVVEVVKWLAHAHHHDVGDGAAFATGHKPTIIRTHAAGEVAQTLTRHKNLPKDFASGEVAHQLLRACVAK